MYNYDDVANTLSKLLVPLREGAPLPVEAYNDVVAMFRNLKAHFSTAAQIPKDLARLLLEVHPYVVGAAVDSRRSDREREELELWAAKLVDEISAILD